MAGWMTIGPHQDGIAQMALDRSMAETTANDGLTRVRFYQFQPPCLSLGFHQNRGDIDESAVIKHGCTVAIRPTGGRAVLHKGDFVYSLATPDTGRTAGTMLHTGVYNLVSLALARGLRELGVEPDGAARHLTGPPSENLPKLCFASTTRHEITVGGKKLVGSAQRLYAGVVLQHGSLLVTREHLELIHLLAGLDREQRARTMKALEARTVCLRDLGITADFDRLAGSFRDSFRGVFDGLTEVDNATIATPQSAVHS
ncbi:MAG: hypothetical protein V2A56_02015 [bacterium]